MQKGEKHFKSSEQAINDAEKSVNKIIEHVYRLDRMIFKYRKGWAAVDGEHEAVFRQVDRIHRHLTTGLNDQANLNGTGGFWCKKSVEEFGAEPQEQRFDSMEAELHELKECIDGYEELCDFFSFFAKDKGTSGEENGSASGSPAKEQ